MASSLVRTSHAHGCRRCHVRYRDACSDPGTNAQCFTCRTGKPGFPQLLHGQAPRDCCRSHSRTAMKEEHATYRLAGDAVWLICTVCKRTFPYEIPRERKTP